MWFYSLKVDLSVNSSANYARWKYFCVAVNTEKRRKHLAFWGHVHFAHIMYTNTHTHSFFNNYSFCLQGQQSEFWLEQRLLSCCWSNRNPVFMTHSPTTWHHDSSPLYACVCVCMCERENSSCSNEFPRLRADYVFPEEGHLSACWRPSWSSTCYLCP